MKALAAIFFFVLTLSLHAQEQKDLVGKWQFEDVTGKESLDSTAIKMLHQFFGNMQMEFNEDGSYSAVIMGSEEKGKWAFAEKTITLSSDRGMSESIPVKRLTKENLTLDLKGKGFILKKVVSE